MANNSSLGGDLPFSYLRIYLTGTMHGNVCLGQSSHTYENYGMFVYLYVRRPTYTYERSYYVSPCANMINSP